MNAMTYALVPLAQATIERLLDHRIEPNQTLDAIITMILDETDTARQRANLPARETSQAAPASASAGDRIRPRSGERGLVYQMFGTAHYAHDANEAFLAILRHWPRVTASSANASRPWSAAANATTSRRYVKQSTPVSRNC
jgi:hypothetical protein